MRCGTLQYFTYNNSSRIRHFRQYWPVDVLTRWCGFVPGLPQTHITTWWTEHIRNANSNLAPTFFVPMRWINSVPVSQLNDIGGLNGNSPESTKLEGNVKLDYVVQYNDRRVRMYCVWDARNLGINSCCRNIRDAIDIICIRSIIKVVRIDAVFCILLASWSCQDYGQCRSTHAQLPFFACPWSIVVCFQYKLSLEVSVVVNKFVRSAGSLQGPW
jgi:hypothetical protein